jgi:glutathione peroxidase
MTLHQFISSLVGTLVFLSFNAQAKTTTSTEKKVAETAPATPASCPAILQHKFKRLQDDKEQDLCQYTDKVILVVNTASYCGFTKQYEGLEALYAKYADKGFVVLGFPSNDFGEQEPGDSKAIADFCYNTYGVKFPMFAKSSVHGEKANPLYVELIKATGTTPKWNFYKYLIDRKGKVVDSYVSLTTPESKTLVNAIEKALSKKGTK